MEESTTFDDQENPIMRASPWKTSVHQISSKEE
jgi:hypothetical protein